MIKEKAKNQLEIQKQKLNLMMHTNNDFILILSLQVSYKLE